MGFSVTVTHAIFFIALLSASSAAVGAYWDTARTMEDARTSWSQMASSEVDTNLTISVGQCTGGCNAGSRQVRLDVRNSGTTVVDYRNLTYIIDGVAHTVTNTSLAQITSPATVSNTDLILPGETMEITLPSVVLSSGYSTSTLPVQIVTLDGVFGRR